MRTITSANAKPIFSNVLQVVAAPVIAIGSFLNMLAATRFRMEETKRLNAMSDADLAARGLTRAGEVDRIFSDRIFHDHA